MNKHNNFILAFALTFLIFIQMTGILVESIYILDLMNTSLDAKVLGLLFFFSPVLLIPFRKRTPPLGALAGLRLVIYYARHQYSGQAG